MFIFAKSKEKHENLRVDVDIVFYFGELTEQSFYRLKEAMIIHNMLNKKNLLYIYHYNRDINYFRKIKPNVKSLFKGECLKVRIKLMENTKGLPTWMEEAT